MECEAESYTHSNMQYAELEVLCCSKIWHEILKLNSPNHYHLRRNSNETGMCSILIYQADRIEIDNEQPEYTSFEFLSDIGGSKNKLMCC